MKNLAIATCMFLGCVGCNNYNDTTPKKICHVACACKTVNQGCACGAGKCVCEDCSCKIVTTKTTVH